MDNQTIEKYKYDHIESHLNYWLDNNNMTFEQAYEKYEEEWIQRCRVPEV